MNIIFDTLHLYYLTQYLPVWRELEKRGIECAFNFYHDDKMDHVIEKVIQKENLKAEWVASMEEAAVRYEQKKPDWVVFGNGFSCLDKLSMKTAQLYHGIGMKSDVYQPQLMEMDIRFIEGPHYTELLQKMYPERPLLEVGYAKLDPLFGLNASDLKPDPLIYKLDPAKSTLLYAPTFYPSSIEMMGDNFPDDFNDYNLIIKPHPFTWSKKQYKNQRRKLNLWLKRDNVVIPEQHDFNLLPFMNKADLMISDASSALFEFAALGKPVIWCDFLKLRWNYRGIFRYRFKRRMDDTIYQYADIAAHAANYKELKNNVKDQMAHPEQYSAKRKEYTARLIGKTDGNVSKRIVDYLLKGE